LSLLPISRRINGERLLLLAWPRAILLQFAHPLVAAGVADHSGFRQSRIAPLQRLHHTVTAMLSMAFGDEAERRRVIDGIRAIHRRVIGTLSERVGPYPAGTPYSAERSDLLVWVHATLIDSTVRTYELLFQPLTDDERDRYCEEAAAVAIELGAMPADVPATWTRLEQYLAGEYNSGRIVVGDTARRLGHAVLSPGLTVVAEPALRINRTLTLGLLPGHIRAEYGFEWTARQQAAFERTVGRLRRVRRVMPAIVMRWPAAR
jgi:uncharacterized protein (DUF2236 family)